MDKVTALLTGFSHWKAEKKRINNELKALVHEYNTILDDESIPFEIRFDIFFNAPNRPEFKRYDGCVQDIVLPNHGEVSWYDDFYMDRYVKRDLADFLDSIEDKDWTEEDIWAFKEYFMKRKLWSFMNDW